MTHQSKRRLSFLLIFIVCSLLFSLLTVFFQEQTLGLNYIESGTQWARHQAIMQGTAPNAWQFRVLSEFIVAGIIWLLELLKVTHPVAVGFLSFRLIQNFAIFLVAALFYRKLGLSTYLILLGQAALAWGMTHALVYSDLQFSNYSEVAFYLAAGLILLYRKDALIIPLVLLAALNRETSGLILFMPLAARLQLKPRLSVPRSTIVITVVSGAIYAICFFGLRYIYGWTRPLSGKIGFTLLLQDGLDFHAWAQMFATLSILPILALVAYRVWPRTLKAIFWAVVPVWFVIIPFTGGFMETRHYLVPQSLVFIPGALLGAMKWKAKETGDRSQESVISDL